VEASSGEIKVPYGSIGYVDADPGLKPRDGRMVVVLLLAVLLVTGCGEPRSQVNAPPSVTTTSVVTAPSSIPPSTSVPVDTSTEILEPESGQVDEDFENGGALVPNFPDVKLDPGETVLIPLEFEGAPRASIMLLLDSLDGVTARFGDTLLGTSDFFGGEVLATLLVDPIDGDLEVVNGGSGSVAGGVSVLLDSPRHLSVDVEPIPVEPGGAVEISVMLTDSSPDDQVEIEVTSPGGTPFIFPAAELDSTGRSTTTFAPDGSGIYTLVARVEGSRPRLATGLIDVRGDDSGSDNGGDP